jgi:small multidrug resistance family-3 protein
VALSEIGSRKPADIKMMPPDLCSWRKSMILETAMLLIRTLALFVLTAFAEILGCFLPYLWLKKDRSAWLLVPAALSLALFAYLLTLHPAAAGRVYAAYGGVYIAVALVWLWKVDGIALTAWDLTGAAVALVGMSIIVWGGWRA